MSLCCFCFFSCTTCGVRKAYETNERGKCQTVQTGCGRNHAEILSDVERRGGNAAPASQVLSKFWVTGRYKKLRVFHFKSTINRKQSRVKYVKSTGQLAELYPDDSRVSSTSLPKENLPSLHFPPRPGSRLVRVRETRAKF